jgi:hypothetical protein
LADPNGAKELNTVLKGLGLNGTRLGAMLCEANTLQGRAVGSVDLVEEAAYRCRSEDVEASVIGIDPEKLRPVVRSIMQRELASQEVEFDDIDDFWSKRWLWCVNGAHNKVLSRKEPQYAIGDDLPAQVHRRVFAERCEVNPVNVWSGKTYYTGSEKLEHGKRRCIFSCDSATYVCFEHLLKPVERAWRNEVAILDPGALGSCGTALRLAEYDGTHVMLDYDDFNSQHSTSSMQVVFEELAALTGYPPHLAEKIIASFEKGEVYVKGSYVGDLQGTLMSGHRATTFINTVLNEAYVLCSAPWVRSWPRMHVGDDVYINASSVFEGGKVLEACQEYGLRMNRAKQSFGRHTREFLRVATGSRGSFGYFARSVASVVSGVWSAEKRYGQARVREFVNAAWTLRARSGVSDIGMLLRKATCAKTRLKAQIVRDLLTHKVAVGEGSPVWGRNFEYKYVVLREDEGEKFLSEMAQNVRSRDGATTTYLSEHTTLVERAILVDASKSLKGEMVDSSYGKTLPYQESEKQVVGFDGPRAHRMLRREPIVRLLRKKAEKGCLTRYPLLVLMKDYLPRRLIRKAITLAGFEPEGDVVKQAWGESSSYCGADSVLPYGEMSQLAAKVGGCYIFSNRDVNV